MITYALGQQHPILAIRPQLREYVAMAPQLQIEIGEGGFEVHCYLRNPTDREIQAFESQPVYFAFRDVKGILVGWMKIGDETFLFEFTYNATPLMQLPQQEREELVNWPPGAFLGVPMILTDSSTGIIRALRFGTLNSHCSTYVINHIRQQLVQGPMGPAMAQSVINQFMKEYPSFKKAWASAAVQTKLGAKSG